MKLRTKKKETWITITNKENEEMKFLVSPLTPKEIDSLLEECTSTEWENNQRFKEPALYKYKINKIDKVIKDWIGALDENDNPIECNKFNKENIFLFNPKIIDEVLDKADKLAEENLKEEEKERKNLKTVQNGMDKKDK